MYMCVPSSKSVLEPLMVKLCESGKRVLVHECIIILRNIFILASIHVKDTLERNNAVDTTSTTLYCKNRLQGIKSLLCLSLGPILVQNPVTQSRTQTGPQLRNKSKLITYCKQQVIKCDIRKVYNG